MNTEKNNYSAVILAGGNSSRMGFPKPWLKTTKQHAFLTTIINTFSAFGVGDIVVVINRKFTEGEWRNAFLESTKTVTVVKNAHPEMGRLHSIQLGLKAAKNEAVFIHNVDNPFIEVAVLEAISKNMEQKGVTIPSFENKAGHPVLIGKAVKDELINNHETYTTLKASFLPFPKIYVEVDSNSILKNINTPEAFKHECV